MLVPPVVTRRVCFGGAPMNGCGSMSMLSLTPLRWQKLTFMDMIPLSQRGVREVRNKRIGLRHNKGTRACGSFAEMGLPLADRPAPTVDGPTEEMNAAGLTVKQRPRSFPI